MSTPIPSDVGDTPPAFNPFDPASLAFYVTTILGVVGFVLHKDLTDLAGPVALGISAVLGIVISVAHAIKYKSWVTATASIAQSRAMYQPLAATPALVDNSDNDVKAAVLGAYSARPDSNTTALLRAYFPGAITAVAPTVRSTTTP